MISIRPFRVKFAGTATVRAWLLVAITWAVGTAHALPTFEEVRTDFRPSDTMVLDRDGELLQRVRTDTTVRRGQWVPLADISPALRTAMVVSEDKRFWEHSGVDWQAASAAAWGNLWNKRTRGASTLTMQLAGLLDGDWRQGPGGRTVVQKVGQTVAAQVLDRRWRKDQILETYLNLVPFRGEIVGIDALSRTLFGKAAHGMDAREAAVAAALVRGPNASAAVVTRRACEVLRDAERAEAVTATSARATGGATSKSAKTAAQGPVAKTTDCLGLELFVAGALQRKSFDANEGIAPHLARKLLKEQRRTAITSAQASLTTSVSVPLQRFAVQTLQQQLRELRGRHVEDGAIVVLDNATGEVLAWVGSSGELSAAAEVDGVLAQRQPGSTLKPFLYAQAIAEKRLTAASLLEDAPTHIPTASGLYIPQNYDRKFHGWVSVRSALGASMNVPAVRALTMVSPDGFARQLGAVGISLAQPGDYYGYSLALGSAEVSLLALTNGFRALANGGKFSDVRYAHVAGNKTRGNERQAIDARAAFIVGDILSDGNARARTFGTDSVLATRFWSAVKTGTSKDMRDNWAVGWSQRYTVGVWVGNAAGGPMWDVSGTSGAAPIWAAVMGYLHRGTPSRAPAVPPGLVATNVSFGESLEAPRSEWFLRDTQQPLFARDDAGSGARKTARAEASAAATVRPRITAPAAGSIIALDPDIPPNNQRLSFTAEGADPRWRMDGKPLGRGASVPWLPWPGRHSVQLVSERGEVLDEIRIEVRGAGIKVSKDITKPGRLHQ